MVEDRVDVGIGAVRGRREALSDHEHRVDTLGLTAVDARLDHDRDLDVVAKAVQELAGPSGILEGELPDLEPVLVVAALLRRVLGIEDCDVQVAAPDRGIERPPTGR